MLSLNVPVPGEVERLAGDLRPALTGFEKVRDTHTLVLKRLDDEVEGGRPRVEGRVRQALSGSPAFEARITGIEAFHEPTAGPGPVLYFAVESPGLLEVHQRLVDALGRVEGLEGPDYTPHVTLARGGNPEGAKRLIDREIEPVTWTVRTLYFWDARYRERIGTVALPA